MVSMEADFPRDPADISLHWLSRVVGLSRAVNGGENANLQLLPIGDDQGASARVLRAEITWRGNSDLPKSVVLKFASAKAEYREYARTMGTYLKEVRFYQHFGADASLPIPKVHFADIDEATGEFLIVMEDLGGARMADWFADGADDVRAALTALAGIHAKFWGDESLSALARLPCSDDEQQGGQYETMLRQLLPTAKAKFAGLLSEYSWSVLDAWADNFELVRRSAASAPKTARYLFKQQKLSTVLLYSVPWIDVLLLAAVVMDLRSGSVATFAHGLAAAYIGFTVAFGRVTLDWADARFAHRFAGGDKPEKPPSCGRELLIYEVKWFGRGRYDNRVGFSGDRCCR